MATKPVTDPHKAWNIQHHKRLEAYNKRIERLLNQAISQAVELALRYGATSTKDKPFFYAQNRQLKADTDRLLKDLADEITALTKNGEGKEWEKAYQQATEYLSEVYKVAKQTETLQNIWDERLLAMKVRNLDALKAFEERKIGGLNLSKKIWNYTSDFEKQLEVTIDQALLEGKSADSLSRDIRSLLLDPDKLFRRVRDDDDQLRMSRAMQAFHPGRGKYRSAYMNAKRLAVSEINMAYRASDDNVANTFDACVGIRINLSNNHTCNGKPFVDICDFLQGNYPKDFKFVGWHPFCRCYITYILKTDEEFWRDLQDGVNRKSVNTVKDVPDAFKEWVAENEERIIKWDANGKMPYFLRDNRQWWDEEAMELKRQQATIQQAIAPKPAPFQYDEIKDFGFTYSDDNIKKPWSERVRNLLDGMEATQIGTGWQPLINLVRSMDIDNQARAKALWENQLKDYRTNDHVAVYQSVIHLNELKNADLSVVPAQWQYVLNDLIKTINEHDMSKGCFGVYHEIEHAYNIYQLSTLPEAIDYGLDKLSDKTPYQLFSVLQKKLPGKTIPPKEFFDQFDTFVPMVTKGEKDRDAYFSHGFGHVCIGVNKKDLMDRLETSEWYRDGLIFHEYGHALDYQKGLKESSEFQKIYDDWKAEMLKDNGASLRDAIYAIWQPKVTEFKMWWAGSDEKAKALQVIKDAKTSEEYKKAWKEYDKEYSRLYKEHLYDLEEQIGALSDCLQAAVDGRETIKPRGHKNPYFFDRDNQLAEFMAHCSEIFWSGNKYFKQLAPDLYELMYDYINGLQ